MTETFNGKVDDAEGLRVKVGQLEQALSSRIVIEQAKGVLSERFQLTVDDAFHVLRRSARNARMNIHALAAQVVNEQSTPREITATLEAR